MGCVLAVDSDWDDRLNSPIGDQPLETLVLPANFVAEK
jgi:hypothetical protein